MGTTQHHQWRGKCKCLRNLTMCVQCTLCAQHIHTHLHLCEHVCYLKKWTKVIFASKLTMHWADFIFYSIILCLPCFILFITSGPILAMFENCTTCTHTHTYCPNACSSQNYFSIFSNNLNKYNNIKRKQSEKKRIALSTRTMENYMYSEEIDSSKKNNETKRKWDRDRKERKRKREK